jgi:hypothetical protein
VTSVHPFRIAAETGDHDALVALLAENVVFTSPVAFKPYAGKALTTAILLGVSRVFEDLGYVREISSADGRDHALIFTARVGDLEINGCDFLHIDAAGLIDDLTVMVRPLSAAKALSAAMAVQFERATRELGLDGR